MGQFLGQLGINPADRLNDLDGGVEIFFQDANDFAVRYQAEIDGIFQIFVDGDTEKYTEIVKTTAGGDLEEMGQDPQAQPKDTRVKGDFPVGFPLTTAGAALSWSEVERAHMIAGDFERQMMGILTSNAQHTGFAIRKALQNNTNFTFRDKFVDDIAVKKLANQDGTLYNPKVGEQDESQRQHYIGLNNATINDANNPFNLITTKFQETFGTRQGGERIMTFIHIDEVSDTENLGSFVELSDDFVVDNVNVDQLTGLPVGFPGTLIGRIKGKSWVVQWDYQESGYMIAVHLDQPKPLVRRVYPASTGLARGFNMVATVEDWPLTKLIWVKHEGYAVRNRTNGVALQVVASTTYTTPTVYT